MRSPTTNLHQASLLAAAAIAVSALMSCDSSSSHPRLSVVLHQDVVTLHEPIYLVITLKNQTAQRVEVDFGIAKIGAFSVEVVPENAGDVRKRTSPVGPTTFHTGGRIGVEAGERYTATDLLTERFAVDSPGTYRVGVRFTGTVMNEKSEELAVAREFHLPLNVLPRDPERLRERAQSLLDTACSRDLGAALAAAKALRNIEDVAITGFLTDMLGCSYLAQVEAVAGLRRLGTSEAIEALTEAASSSDQDLAELARIALRSTPSVSPLDPELRRRSDEVLQD